MTFSEILETIGNYLNDSSLMANLSLIFMAIINIIKAFRRTRPQTTEVVVNSNEDEIKELKNELSTMKEMFLVAFNNSKLDSATKIKLSEIATKSNKIVKNSKEIVEDVKSIDFEKDIVEPIKSSILEKADKVANQNNSDLLKQISDKISEI